MVKQKQLFSSKNISASNATQYVKLEQRLVLMAYLNNLLGYSSNSELLKDIKNCEEGFDSSGRSHIYHLLQKLGSKVKISSVKLAQYDDNIRDHLKAINANTHKPITLRYFQYLAVLYTEIFLDRYFHSKKEMLMSLNVFVAKRNASKKTSDPKDENFSESDLKKVAFWMATGSGKTLIMHINYKQFLHYNNLHLDNVLLITPNEGLSEQHMIEMTTSGIPCHRFNLNENSLMMFGKDVVKVIEITKLVNEKRGQGERVPVDAFEGNNLIFVDEGHKGSVGEAWRSYRDVLGETGFTFEYSATFGQALKASGNQELTTEYGKAIIFDYSYRYFHGDGYGKDFYIINIKEDALDSKTDTLLLGNLLSFYEQQKVFEEQEKALRPYNMEKPLWIFVGGTVNAIYRKNNQDRSDVLIIVQFLHQVLENKHNWVVKTISKLIEGKAGLVTYYGQDIFKDKFKYLRENIMPIEEIYQDILTKVFHTKTGGRLHLCDIHDSSGEIGLKAGGAEDYFGLIYIGDRSRFKKLVEDYGSDITLEEDVFTDSLFNSIADSNTTIDVLIGAKKFMEGWNSWRVSSMGLLNIGRKEGSQIIQLFGRGVRLRGKQMSLKRSTKLRGDHPNHLELLETLNIFAVRANYMSLFRDYLEKEGVETENNIELPLAIKPNEEFFGKGLVMPRVPENRSFVKEEDILLEPDSSVDVLVDLSFKAEVLESSKDGLNPLDAYDAEVKNLPEENLDLVDWQKIYLDILEYKERKEFSNFAIHLDVPRLIIETSSLYKLVADESVFTPRSFTDINLLHRAIISILKKYVDKFYRVRQERWETNNMIYMEIDKQDPNFQNYTIISAPNKADKIQKLIEEAVSIYQQDTQELPTIHFDRHFYQPLLVEGDDNIKSQPQGLNFGESRFVENLRKYCKAEKNKSLAGKEVFLLRNLSRGKGVRFFDKRGFYPDFILWIKDDLTQRIVFIEPHGMIYAKPYSQDDKAQLHKSLPEVAKEISNRTKLKNVILDSFIISTTPYEELKENYDDGSWDLKRFAEAHILFPEYEDYLTHVILGSGKNFQPTRV